MLNNPYVVEDAKYFGQFFKVTTRNLNTNQVAEYCGYYRFWWKWQTVNKKGIRITDPELLEKLEDFWGQTCTRLCKNVMPLHPPLPRPDITK